MGPFGVTELILVFVVALLVFGPKKLPEIGKTLGKGMREFKKATDDLKSNWEDHIKETDSPIHDLKETIHEVKAEVEAPAHELKAEIEASTTIEPEPAATPEETKPDAHTN